MDADGLTSPTYAYQWINVDSGTDSDIFAQIASTYYLIGEDEGKTFKVRVTFRDDAGNAERLTSEATAVVAPHPSKPDRAALVALYNATGGADWTNNTNWLNDTSLSNWHGVNTDGNDRVTGLYLSGNGLSGEIPDELGNLTNLYLLYLYGNMLSGEIPGELGSLTNLQQLILNQNMLSGEIPDELGNLANLLYLYLYENELSGEVPGELGSLTNLQALYLSTNELSGPLPLTLTALSQLSVLDVRSTTVCALPWCTTRDLGQ